MPLLGLPDFVSCFLFLFVQINLYNKNFIKFNIGDQIMNLALKLLYLIFKL